MSKSNEKNCQNQIRNGKGFIPLSREIMNLPFYLIKEASSLEAWIDMLLLAQYVARGFMSRGIHKPVNRGQLAYSQKKLASRWGWSIGKVKRYLFTLKVIGLIDYQNDNVTTLITILSYDNVLGMGSQMDTQTNIKRTSNELHNKKEMKEKNINISSIEFYNEQLKLPGIHPDYKKFVSLILGENILDRP